MENEQQNKITLINRKKMIIEGVKKLIAFDDKEFQMETNLGNLKITGVNFLQKFPSKNIVLYT